ncbi:hypothetical protein [Nocardia sp. NPDC058633]|uniref:hypothetical protein n=1 Tax=Nocardia sp. NPDC058633 TaxID=3346568 RepID=UPI0036604B94
MRENSAPGWTPSRAWIVVLLGAAAFRWIPSVLIEALHTELGWSPASISIAYF